MGGGPPPPEENGEEIPKTDNASQFLNMRGPFVPNLIKIGQLVQKYTVFIYNIQKKIISRRLPGFGAEKAGNREAKKGRESREPGRDPGRALLDML